MSAHDAHWHQREDLKPNYAHGFWWFMFANGGAIAAVLLPVTILVAGVLGPLGVPNWMEDAKHFGWTLSNPLIKLYLAVLIFLTFVHAAHRIRYALFDFGLRGSVVALEWICYGLAIVASIGALALIVVTP
jgi:fumarate reductase subunit D